MSTWPKYTSVASSKTGQINFRKKLAKTLIFNTHYNEDDDKTLEKSPSETFLAHESSQQTVNIHSTYEAHAKWYIPIVYAPQESTGVQNAANENPPKRCANAHQYHPDKTISVTY